MLSKTDESLQVHNLINKLQTDIDEAKDNFKQRSSKPIIMLTKQIFKDPFQHWQQDDVINITLSPEI
jgi:hypothetical protein